MEFMSDQERFEHGGLLRDIEAPLAVAALQLIELTEDISVHLCNP